VLRVGGVNGRQKGARAEREVAGLLAGWWGKIERGCEFVRVPSSGGWATPKLRGDFRVSGDLATTAKKFPWVVEVKHREQWTWERLLAGKPSPVWSWWKQAERQAAEMKLDPMLWFRRNRETWSVMAPLLPPIHPFGAPRAGVCIYDGEDVLGSDPGLFVWGG
jgi:Holliday junction resolvase